MSGLRQALPERVVRREDLQALQVVIDLAKRSRITHPYRLMAVGSTVLVTGGAGYIGSHAVLGLVDRGQAVVVLDDLSTGHQRRIPKGVPFIRVALQRQNWFGPSWRSTGSAV